MEFTGSVAVLGRHAKVTRKDGRAPSEAAPLPVLPLLLFWRSSDCGPGRVRPQPEARPQV